MCIIIHVPAGIELPSKETLEHCWEQNPHNGGIMYVLNEDVKIEKFTEFEKYHERVMQVHSLYGKQTPIVTHMRYATAGEKTLDNTHPFMVRPGVAVCHNGTLKDFPEKDGKSDTIQFVENVLANMPAYWYLHGGLKKLMELYLGWSRLVVLDKHKNVAILNESSGDWVKGVWYSNDYYKTKRNVVWFSGYGGYTYASTVSTSQKEQTDSSRVRFYDYTGDCKVCGQKTALRPFFVYVEDDNNPLLCYFDVCAECAKMWKTQANMLMLENKDCLWCRKELESEPEKRAPILFYSDDEAHEGTPIIMYGEVCPECASYPTMDTNPNNLRTLASSVISGSPRLFLNQDKTLTSDLKDCLIHFIEWTTKQEYTGCGGKYVYISSHTEENFIRHCEELFKKGDVV